jgi:hypothetical protein
MAKNIWDTLYNTVQETVTLPLTGSITATNKLLSGTSYNFDYDVFPEDLSSSYYGHWMKITAKVSNDAASASYGPFDSVNRSYGKNTSAYSVGLFIPGAGENGSGVIYEDKHEYTDIKLTNAAGAGLAAMAGFSLGGVASAGMSAIGKPINPGVQVLYKNTYLRAFQYAFLMAPASLRESQSMENIIKQLRRFAAPNVAAGGGGLLFDTPAEFTIEFFNKGQPNPHIPKVSRCVLTNITTDFTPSGEWSTFRNGYPVTCRLLLSFQEMEIITRDKIEGGF